MNVVLAGVLTVKSYTCALIPEENSISPGEKVEDKDSLNFSSIQT